VPKKWSIKDTEVIKPWYPQVASANTLKDARQKIANPMVRAFLNATGLSPAKLLK